MALERRSARMPGSRAKALLQQLSRSSSRAGVLRVPMYDEEGVRLVLGECGALYEQIRDLMGDDHKPIEQVPDAVKVALVVHHQTILRNKRCLLAYHQARERAAAADATRERDAAREENAARARESVCVCVCVVGDATARALVTRFRARSTGSTC